MVEVPQATLVRQRPAAHVSSPTPGFALPVPSWVTTEGPDVAALLIVRAGGCKSDSAGLRTSDFSIALHDPRPEAGNDMAPMDGGRSLRWIPKRGGLGGEMLIYPAWMHHSLTLPANPSSCARTFLSVFGYFR